MYYVYCLYNVYLYIRIYRLHYNLQYTYKSLFIYPFHSMLYVYQGVSQLAKLSSIGNEMIIEKQNLFIRYLIEPSFSEALKAGWFIVASPTAYHSGSSSELLTLPPLFNSSKFWTLIFWMQWRSYLDTGLTRGEGEIWGGVNFICILKIVQ